MVETVSVADFPDGIEFGVMAHWGANCGVGDTEHVSTTELLKPAIAVISMVEVADCPGLTAPGTKSEAETLKSGVMSKVPVNAISEFMVTTHSNWV
jgi:hypothetical protein